MANDLENLCETKGIKVEFITHKFIDNASELKNNQPVIKVHKIFKQCPMSVAAAVMEIFTQEGHTANCVTIIEGYLREKFGPIGIKVQQPKVIIKKPLDKEIMTNKEIINTKKEEEENHNAKINKKNISNKEDLYIEADIASIDVINMKGQQKKLDGSNTLTAKDEGFLELDIVVEPPIT